jgi:hypothetical protein
MNPTQVQASLDGRYAPRHKQILTKEVNSEMVLVDMQRGVYHGLNVVGVEVWKLLDGSHTLGDIVSTLQKSYSHIDSAIIEADVLSLVQALLDNELVIAQ